MANDPYLDHNGIGWVIVFGAVLKIIKNILLFITMAYFGGLFWLIWCDISLNYISRPDESSFLLAYNLNFMDHNIGRSHQEMII